MAREPALIIFARAPIAGETKTRLIPALGAAGAAALYRCFLLDTLAQACHTPASVIVAVAEPCHLNPVRALVEEACAEASLIVQSGANLGERIANAVRQAFARGFPRAVVIGSDSPSLPPDRLSQALDLSGHRDLVLGPSLDGGYYLIGLRALLPELFRGIAWSSDTVLLDTLGVARRSGVSVALLEPWYDVDTPQDLSLLRTHLTALSLAGGPIPCPRTWEYLQRLPEGEKP